MCGLVGILLEPGERPKKIWGEISSTFTRCLLFNQERGREASGIALVKRNSVDIFKLPVQAEKLVRYRRYKKILQNLDSMTLLLLGHTREPTKGSPNWNKNNHPIKVAQVIGIHNGKLENDDELFEEFNFSRSAEVDSEIIFQIMASINPQKINGDYLAELNQRLSRVKGNFAVIAVDLRLPQQLIVAKKDCPLCLHYEGKWRALIFSSRYLFLRKAFGRQVLGEALESGYIYSFDASELGAKKGTPSQTINISYKR